VSTLTKVVRHASGGTIVCVSRDDILITATELAQRLSADGPLTILDVRWQLTEPDGRAGYERGTSLARCMCPLKTSSVITVSPGVGATRCRPGAVWRAAARRWGVRTVSPSSSRRWKSRRFCRAWWVLTAAGTARGAHPRRRLSAGRTARDRQCHTGTRRRDGAHDDLYAGSRPTLTAEDRWRNGRDADRRAGARAFPPGEVEPVDPVAGHIPGAANVPTAGC